MYHIISYSIIYPIYRPTMILNKCTYKIPIIICNSILFAIFIARLCLSYSTNIHHYMYKIYYSKFCHIIYHIYRPTMTQIQSNPITVDPHNFNSLFSAIFRNCWWKKVTFRTNFYNESYESLQKLNHAVNNVIKFRIDFSQPFVFKFINIWCNLILMHTSNNFQLFS